MTLALALLLFGLAFCGAFVSGLVGVGGAVVMIPLLYYVPAAAGRRRAADPGGGRAHA